MTLKGWIVAEEDERVELEGMGIVLGDYDPINSEFVDCVVSPTAMAELDTHWGRFHWGLASQKTTN